MDNNKEASGALEWRIRLSDGSSQILVPESGPIQRVWSFIVGVLTGIVRKVCNFFNKAKDVGLEDPRKIIHCLKVGVALTLVSLFYYMRPLYEGVGGNAMWAVLTVVVIFEFTVGATISKSLNRVTGTLLAGSLGFGVHWAASQAGEDLEPIILRTSVFILAAVATFSRFIPAVKARFDYGAMIFILTFSLVSVSSYRVDDLFTLARQRLLTVLIGGSMCLLITMLIRPVWAGQDLHLLIIRNMEKLAKSLDGCIAEYFEGSENVSEESCKQFQGYKCVLNSKASEEALANFARWEPAHGRFSFRHPWKQYLKIGASVRSCAYCIEALNGCINSEIQAPEVTKKHLNTVCMRLSSISSSVLRELAIIIKTMKRSQTLDFSLEEMKSAVQDIQNALTSFPAQLNTLLNEAPQPEKTEDLNAGPVSVPLIEILQVMTLSSLLIEIEMRIEVIVSCVEELAGLADFDPACDSKPKETKLTHMLNSDTIVTLEQVSL